MTKNILKIACLLIISCLMISQGMAQTGIKIVEKNGKFELYVDGVSTYIKGVGGTNKIDLAAKNGANAFRTWSGDVEEVKKDLALAKANNMYIMQGIWLSHDRKSYFDEEYKNKTRKQVMKLAEAFKDDPNILVWGIGNEIDHGEKANFGAAWIFVDELAQLIKTISPRHLVSTVITHNQSALDSIDKYTKNLDLVGINSYGGIAGLEAMVEKSNFKGAYMITEWGPTGFWETSKTKWNAPIEQSSEEKRIVYEDRYNNAISGSKRCLGSFVFLWGQKEERTPTWFSMFVENSVDGLPLKGEKTPMVEAMERVWKGVELTQTAPVIQKFTINGKAPIESPTVAAGQSFEGNVTVTDKEDHKLTYVWEILKEATVLGSGGSYEPRPDRVGKVETTQSQNFKTAITEPGNYRLYVYVLDNTGFASSANVPFQIVKDTLKVLFVGNSYTYVENLPQLVSIMSNSAKTKLVTRKSTVGGAFLSEHWFSKRGLKTKEIISKGRFDAVILQENSMATINQPDSTIKYAKLLCGLITKSGAKPYLYMTWAREKVPQYQDEITRVHSEIAKENGAVLVPVGEAWELAKQLRPTIELYNADGSHPSNLGAILSAYVFVGALTGEVPAEIPEWYQIKDEDGETVELTSIDRLDAVFFRKVAEKTLHEYGFSK